MTTEQRPRDAIFKKSFLCSDQTSFYTLINSRSVLHSSFGPAAPTACACTSTENNQINLMLAARLATVAEMKSSESLH